MLPPRAVADILAGMSGQGGPAAAEGRLRTEASSVSPSQPAIAVLAGSLEHARALAHALAERGFDVTALCIVDSRWGDLCVTHAEIIRIAARKLYEGAEVVDKIGASIPKFSRETEPAESPEVIFGLTPAERGGWKGNVFRLGPLCVDRRGSIADLGGVQLDISDMLFELLIELCDKWNPDGGTAYVRADWNDIYFLRHAFGSHRDLIVTARGRGYRLATDPNEAQAIAGERARRRARSARANARRRKPPR